MFSQLNFLIKSFRSFDFNYEENGECDELIEKHADDFRFILAFLSSFDV